jgi:hypothetical protein
MNRNRVTGTLNVYRESSQVEHLSAHLIVDGKDFYYPICPKCFDDLIVDGCDNFKCIEVTINEDGSNPRTAKLV